MNREVNINYFDSNLMKTGLKPFLLAVFIFIFFKKLLIADFKQIIKFDIYHKISTTFVKTGQKLSNWHSGNLSEYLLWAVTALVILWVKINII